MTPSDPVLERTTDANLLALAHEHKYDGPPAADKRIVAMLRAAYERGFYNGWSDSRRAEQPGGAEPAWPAKRVGNTCLPPSQFDDGWDAAIAACKHAYSRAASPSLPDQPPEDSVHSRGE